MDEVLYQEFYAGTIVVSRIPSWDHRGNWSEYSVDGFPGMTE